jgi:hypothetical protein
VNLVILVLASARLTRLVVTDTLLQTPREWWLRRWPAEDTVFGDSEVTGNRLRTGVEVFREADGWYPVSPSMLGALITCVWCAGFWVAVLVWTAYQFYPEATVLVAAPFAFSYVIGWLDDRS